MTQPHSEFHLFKGERCHLTVIAQNNKYAKCFYFLNAAGNDEPCFAYIRTEWWIGEWFISNRNALCMCTRTI